MSELVWDPDSVDRNARQLTEGLVEMLDRVERPLRRAALPEMPAPARAEVTASLSAALSVMSDARVTIASVAADLRRRTGQVSTVDRMPDLPWWVKAGDWLGTTPGTARDSFVWTAQQLQGQAAKVGLAGPLDWGAFTKGFLDGTGELFMSAGVLGLAGLEGQFPPLRIVQTEVLGIESAQDRLKRGLAHAVRHPGETAQAVVRWDLLSDGKWRTTSAWSEWAGAMTPGAIVDVYTGGIGSATRAAGRAMKASNKASHAAHASRVALGDRVVAVDGVRRTEQLLADAEARLRAAQEWSKTTGANGGRNRRFSDGDRHVARLAESQAAKDVERLRGRLLEHRNGAAHRLDAFDSAADASRAAAAQAHAAALEAYREAALSTGVTVVTTAAQTRAERGSR